MRIPILILTVSVLMISVQYGFSINTERKTDLTGEVLHVKAASVSVLQWFQYIENVKNVVLSYNPSNINLEQKCTIGQSSDMSIGTLISILLKDYNYDLTVMSGRKIVIRVDKKEEYSISGTVSDESTSERLYGAIITVTDMYGRKERCISDENGIYRINMLEGKYTIEAEYIGFEKFVTQINVLGKKTIPLNLKPSSFEIAEITIKSAKNDAEISEITPSGMLSFSGNDLFSQIWILPGVAGITSGNNFMVDGGSYDENILLLDGVPVYHPGHINALLPQFNGDVIKNIVFHKGFFPTRLEGGLSSVTEFNLKDGNRKEHFRTFSIDMPSASLTLEGPIIKDKISYVIGVRRSWLDFFDRLLSEENRMNHYSLDFNAKLSYSISPSNTIRLLAYKSFDEFRFPIFDEEVIPIVKWNNSIYKLSYSGVWGKVVNNTSVYYSSHMSNARADALGIDGSSGDDWYEDDENVVDNYKTDEYQNDYVKSGIETFNVSSEFVYTPENLYTARWGGKFSKEIYNITSFGNGIKNEKEGINQYSLFYDNYIRINDKVSTKVGIHFIGYIPDNYRDYYSIQPRAAINYSPSEKDLLYLNFSKMEQFYHYLSIDGIALPTDFRMPSIKGFKPRSSEHYEIGWKRNILCGKGKLEVSAYYKTRRNVLALKPDVIVEDNNWKNYIMTGNGDSYGVKSFFYYNLKKWLFQASYTFSRSREWFSEYKELGKLPSIYDLPHYSGIALSYNPWKKSTFSLGCTMKSGRIKVGDNWFEEDKNIAFRKNREPFNYRIDIGYTYKKDFGDKLLLLRCGLYNLFGNPTEEDIIDFYSVHFSGRCLPYGGISFKF